MRRRAALLVTVSLVPALQGCDGCARKEAPDATLTPAPTPAAGGKGQPLGEALNVDAGQRAAAPALDLFDGRPIAVWVEKGQPRARAWDGKAWAALGGEPLHAGAKNAALPAIGRTEQLVLAWADMTVNDKPCLNAASLHEGAWRPVDPPSALGPHALGPVRLASPLKKGGPLFAAWTQRDAAMNPKLHLARLEKTSWVVAAEAPPSATPDGQVTAHAICAHGEEGLAVAWIEKGPAGRQAHARAWSPTSSWKDLPAPEGADGDTGPFDLVGAPSGELFLWFNWNPGLRPVLRLKQGASAWEPIGLPDPKLERGGYVTGQRLALGPDGSLVAVWAGERLSAARWRDGVWSLIDGAIAAPGEAHEPACAVAPDGALLVAWVEAKGALRVARFAP